MESRPPGLSRIWRRQCLSRDNHSGGPDVVVGSSWARRCIVWWPLVLLAASIIWAAHTTAAATTAPVQSQFSASDKERFDLGMAMLAAYYTGIETRFAGSLALFVVIIGWLITSKDARQVIATNRWFFFLALATLTLVLSMYAWNIAHWLNRWREIRGYVDALHYMEPRFYTRYDLPPGTWWAYVTPIALLYGFIVAYLIAIRAGWLDAGARNT